MLGHEYSADWSFDDDNHWHACTHDDCGAVDSYGPHDWSDWKVTKAATATADGLKERICPVCGKNETEIVPKTGGGEPDPAKQLAPDGTAYGPGASAQVAEAAILALPDDNDPAGTVFSAVHLRRPRLKIQASSSPGRKHPMRRVTSSTPTNAARARNTRNSRP